jgi:hypothetical protein
MSSFHEISTVQLRQALQLREEIDSLQTKLDILLGKAAATPAPKKKAAASPTRGKRTMSPEARARIGAAAKARWARLRGSSNGTTKETAAPKKKRGITPEGRAKIAAAMKARWAARRKS